MSNWLYVLAVCVVFTSCPMCPLNAHQRCWHDSRVAVVAVQMAFSNLRSDNNLIAFNRKLASCNWDLKRWRTEEVTKGKYNKEMEEGFALLDMDNGAGWDLACKVRARRGRWWGDTQPITCLLMRGVARCKCLIEAHSCDSLAHKMH